jgi:hypothetical protein
LAPEAIESVWFHYATIRRVVKFAGVPDTLAVGNKQSNAQGEMQLVAEWITTLPAAWKSKTHIKVGAQSLFYAGMQLTPAQAKAFSVWDDWADARIFTGAEVWLVEGKLVATGGAYGQLLDYLQEYPTSPDYAQFAPAPVIGVVLCQAERPRTASYFATLGIRTTVFQPSFDLASSLAKLFPAAQILQS